MTETTTDRNRRIFDEATAAGEPLFVIRAKDALALHAIERYGVLAATAAGAAGQRFAPEFGAALDDVLAEFRAWRRAHPDQVKYPDLRP